MIWQTKTGRKITGNPQTKSYYILLRDKKGFEKKIKWKGFLPAFNYSISNVESLCSISEGECFPRNNKDYLTFYAKEWLNISTCLYEEI